MKQPGYIEGPKALENLEQLGRAILQAPKPKGKAKKRPKADASRKPEKPDRD
jgi:hypothetical protein